MAAVEEQCCAPGVRGRSGNTGQQQGTTGDRFSPCHWLNQSNKQRPPVIHECRHSGGDLRALEILGCEPAPTPLVLQFVECVLCIAPIPIELGKCEVLPLPLQRGHQNCGKACNGVPQRGGIGDQVDPPSFVVETPFHRATPFHQATTERLAGLICCEKIGLARRRLPPTAVPSRSGSEMSAEYRTPLYAD